MKTIYIWTVKGFSVISLILLLIAMTLSLSQPVYAASIAVTANSSDVIDADASCSAVDIGDLPGPNGDTSLREAICAANNTPGDDDISLPAGTYTLSITGMSEEFNATGDLDIRSNLTITGQDDDARNTIIQAGTDETNGIDRVFHIRNSATVTMEKITVRYGRVGSHGGGIYVDDGTLTLNNSTITENEVTISSHGGGIRVLLGSVTLNNSTVSHNTTLGNGGGIQIEHSTAILTINSSTISNNESGGTGGGIYFNNGTAEINNSTITSNTSNSFGGGGIRSVNGSMTIKNTIIAGNTSNTTSHHDCRINNNSMSSAGYNLVQVTTSDCTIFTETGDVTGSDPNLAALANNGGPTDTHAIPNDSPALDMGDPTNCQDIDNNTITEDQRGATRSYDGNGDMTARCDIGAFEFGAVLAVSLANFGAMNSRDHVVVRWDTVSESDNLGFHVYRSTTNERAETPLNEAMISSQAPGSGQGSSYSYEDYDLEVGTTYYYWLADVDVSNTERYHGPVTVVYDYTPTAVTMSTLDSNSNRVPLAGLAALIGVALIAGGILRRRKW